MAHALPSRRAGPWSGPATLQHQVCGGVGGVPPGHFAAPGPATACGLLLALLLPLLLALLLPLLLALLLPLPVPMALPVCS